MSVNISQKKIYDAKIKKFSSERSKEKKADNLLVESSSWATGSPDGEADFVILDYGAMVSANYINILPSQTGSDLFPSAFRLETGSDTENWTVIHTENSFVLDDNHFIIHFPLKEFRYLKLYISEHSKISGSKYSEIARIETGIYGIASLDISCEHSENHRPLNLIDGYPSTYWSSKPSPSPERIELIADLGTIMYLSSFGMSCAENLHPLFPRNFIMEVSSDGRVWSTMTEQKNFSAYKNSTYSWEIDSIPARYVKVEMDTVETEPDTFRLALASFDIYASPVSTNHSHTFSGSPGYASVFQPGLVRFAKDGEDTRDAAVRASDRRLQDATTFFKGVVQFAENGESIANTAVMSTDSRLERATELSAGIVQLAYEYETKKGTVVQASDPRLQDATEKSSGIVKLCPDGASSELGVVRGSDSRLKQASEKSAGIVKVAKNGSSEIGTVVQANDMRLRDASEFSKGIVQFSADGEAEEGKAVQANDKRLKNASITEKGIVELAEDGEVKAEAVVQSNDRRLKNATTEAKGIVELAEDGEIKPEAVVQSNDRRLKDATTRSKGIVELAEDGESKPEAVVQSNDKRLKHATTVAHGIVILAKDGETEEGKAVQANDKRLRTATTAYSGIVELAEDGEHAQGKVVQSDDKRLLDATEKSRGIMQFAENRESAPLKAVQANDDRLREASIDHKGIVQLAQNGETQPLKALQSSDSRIKDASSESKGIMQFAKHGESSPLKAVQADDIRLQPASSIAAGIVRFAKEGESESGAAVQSTDPRLNDSTEDQKGIVRLAKNNEERKGFAVQAHDDRLSDKRHPLPHDHDYAPKTHEFNSHTGTLSIQGEKAEIFSGIMPPSDEAAIIFGKNSSNEDGAAGICGISLGNERQTKPGASYGVVGHSDFIGVRGQSNGRENGPAGAGVLGISRNAPGGMFISEHNYSLFVDGYANDGQADPTLRMVGDGRAMRVKGSSLFEGPVELTSREEDGHHLNLVELFEIEDNDYISHGDVVVASSKGNSLLKRTHTSYDTAAIGVIANKPALIINNNGEKKKLYPVALAGSVLCKVDARNHPIRPGDLLVTSDTPGCAMKGSIDSFEKIGSVIGKALDTLESGTGVIRIYLTAQ